MPILNKAHLTSKFTTTTGESIDASFDSNTHRTNKVDEDILFVKSSSKEWLMPNEKITLTTTITNNADESISDFTFQDTLSQDATFVAGSLKIGNTAYDTFDPTSGFTAPVTLDGSGAQLTISFDVLSATYPQDYKFTSKSQISFAMGNNAISLNSNEKEIKILNNEIYISKQSDLRAVVSGDVILYTITITNDGEFANTDLFFTDDLPASLEFVIGSVKIDNVERSDLDLATGFALADLQPNGTITITYSAKVK